jgi:hypothetical protein
MSYQGVGQFGAEPADTRCVLHPCTAGEQCEAQILDGVMVNGVCTDPKVSGGLTSRLANFWAASTTNKAILLGASVLVMFGTMKLVSGKKAATPNRRRFRRNAPAWHLVVWRHPIQGWDYMVVPAREQFADVSRLHQDGMLSVKSTRYVSLAEAKTAAKTFSSSIEFHASHGGYANNRRRFRRNGGTGLRSLGLKMHNWHSSMGDPIYAVGSYFVSGKDYPDRDVVVRALDRIERLMLHEKSRANLRELRSIHAGLRKYCVRKGGTGPAPDVTEREHDEYDDDDGWRSDASGRL